MISTISRRSESSTSHSMFSKWFSSNQTLILTLNFSKKWGQNKVDAKATLRNPLKDCKNGEKYNKKKYPMTNKKSLYNLCQYNFFISPDWRQLSVTSASLVMPIINTNVTVKSTKISLLNHLNIEESEDERQATIWLPFICLFSLFYVEITNQPAMRINEKFVHLSRFFELSNFHRISSFVAPILSHSSNQTSQGNWWKI